MAHITKTSSSENLLQDFSRLPDDLPNRPFYSKRQAIKQLSKMSEQIDKDEFIWPKTAVIPIGVKNLLSDTLDASALRVYTDIVHQVQATEQHKKNLKALRDAPRLCGGFKDKKKAILIDATPLEQMIAYDHFLYDRAPDWPPNARTFCFGTKGSDDLIPINLRPTTKVKASTMTTRLGNGGKVQGKLQVIKYEKLAADEDLANNSPLVVALDALEIVRQPYFAGATLLKSNAFSTGIIDHQRRYEIYDPNDSDRMSQFACVELPKQNKPVTSPIKVQSAGANILSLEKKVPKKPLTHKLHYEQFAPEGYKDDVVLQLRPKNFSKTLRRVPLDKNNDITELDRQMTILFLGKFGKFSSPEVNKYFADKLFDVKED